jgi:hypothetical protein
LLVRNTQQHGPDAIRAANNAVDIPRLLRSLDELPEEAATRAVRRLAAGSDGRALAKTVDQFGASALRAEVRHPGIGGRLVGHLGDDGAELASKMSHEQAITFARHADDIASLPKAQRSQVLSLLQNQTDRAVSFMSRFVENNPGKVLFTAAATPVILANSDSLFGGGGMVRTGPDGEPMFVAQTGLLERLIMPVIRKPLSAILPVVALGIAVWLAVKLWFHYRLTKLKYQVAAAGVSQPGERGYKVGWPGSGHDQCDSRRLEQREREGDP